MRIYLAGTIAIVAMTSVVACGDSGDGDVPTGASNDTSSAETPSSGGGPTDPPSQPVAAPKTSVVLCKIENGLPVAEVKVTNTTGEAAAFSVEVQFANGNTVLGTGLEFTQELQPDQNQTIRMGNMQGDAEAVDTCEVLEAAVLE